MDNSLQALILAVIQGLTEFLPISSSAHLILPSQVLGWPDQGQAFDVAVHVGTLSAVVAYFFQDIRRILLGSLVGVSQRTLNPDLRLGVAVVIATIPVVVVGGLFHDAISQHLRSSQVIAWATVVFGLLLWGADRLGKRRWNESDITLGVALLIGLAQALALIPGTSRSGITITAALLLGFNRVTAARFSMLLSIPTILAAGALETLEFVSSAEVVPLGLMLLGMLASAVSAFLCIHLFLKLIERVGMLPFVLYRLALGGLLFWFVGFM